MSALPSWRVDPFSAESPVLAVLPDEELEVEVEVEVEVGVEGIDGIEGIDDEEGDGTLGVEGAPLVAHPASIVAHSAEHSIAVNGNVTGNCDAGRMIRSLQSPSRRGSCATVWRCGCRLCPALLR